MFPCFCFIYFSSCYYDIFSLKKRGFERIIVEEYFALCKLFAVIIFWILTKHFYIVFLPYLLVKEFVFRYYLLSVEVSYSSKGITKEFNLTFETVKKINRHSSLKYLFNFTVNQRFFLYRYFLHINFFIIIKEVGRKEKQMN